MNSLVGEAMQPGQEAQLEEILPILKYHPNQSKINRFELE